MLSINCSLILRRKFSSSSNKYNLNLFFENSGYSSRKLIRKFNPDYIFFPHWNWIVPKSVHTNFKCILFHTAPLSYGRGGSPIQNLILKGYKNVPVCALEMIEELDAGPILIKKNINLKGN